MKRSISGLAVLALLLAGSTPANVNSGTQPFASSACFFATLDSGLFCPDMHIMIQGTPYSVTLITLAIAADGSYSGTIQFQRVSEKKLATEPFKGTYTGTIYGGQIDGEFSGALNGGIAADVKYFPVPLNHPYWLQQHGILTEGR
jgi:hypothetical protein